MANDIWREQQSVKAWIETDGHGNHYVRYECPDCGRTHRCHPLREGEGTASNPINQELPNAGDWVMITVNTQGSSRKGSIPIKAGQHAQVIETREMGPGRFRIWVTLEDTGEDVWVASQVVNILQKAGLNAH